MKLQDALQEFLTQLDADGRSHHTRRQYARHVRAFASWAATAGHDGSIETIDERMVAAFFVAPGAKQRADGGPRKATSANALRTSIRVFLGFAHRAGWTARNPARLLRRAICSGPPPRAITPDDLARLMAALDAGQTDADRRDRVLFRFLLESGTRIGSALNLAIEDLDLDGGFALLRGAKRGRDDRIVLAAGTMAMLRGWIGDRRDGLLFEGVGVRQAQRRLEIWLGRAGVTRRYSPHSFRHAFATMLYAKTGDVLLVKEALRHRSIASTLVYATCSAARVREAMGA